MGKESEKTWGEHLKVTLRLAWPIVTGNVGQILIGVVDTLMIGQVGVAELGASAFVNNLFIIPLVTLMGLLAAVTVLVSQAKGAGEGRQVGRHIKHSVLLTAVVAVATIGLLAINGLFLDRYGQEPEVVQAAGGYYWLIAFSMLPALLYHCLKCVSEGLGWSNPPMVVLLSGIALNIGLNWVLIFGNLGSPAFGLEGAGWATLVARWVTALAMFVFVLRASRFKGLLPWRWLAGYRWARFRSVLKIGLPTAAQHLFEVGAFAGAGIMVGWLGKEALAAHQIAMSCAAMAFMIPLGVSIACGIRIAAAFGSNDFKTIKLVYVTGIGFTFFQTVISATVFLVFGGWLAEQFVDDARVVALAASIFVVAGLFQIFDGMQVASLGALRGMSDVNAPMLISFVAYWVFALPAGYALGFWVGWGAVGVWIGLAVGLFAAATSLLFRLKKSVDRGLLAPTGKNAADLLG